jgi:hypothetical protein
MQESPHCHRNETQLDRSQTARSTATLKPGILIAIFETRQKPMVRTPPRLYLAGSSNSFVFADSVRRFHDLTVSTYRKTLRGVNAAPKTVLTHSPLFLLPLIGVETIFNRLYSLPDVGIALLFGTVGACLLAALPFLREKLLRIQVLDDDESEFASKALNVVIGFTGVVLAFSLVQAHNNLRNLEAQVGTEAHNLAQLDRLLIRYGDPEDAIRVSLREYAGSIVRDEWPELSKGRPSERTRALFRPISRGILAIDPPPGRKSLIYAEMLKKADEIAADRKARVVAATKLELPWIFWETIVALLVVLLLLAAFSEPTFVRAVALGGQGFGLALLVALVFIYDEPFKGQSAVSPEPIVTVVAEMQTRTE